MIYSYTSIPRKGKECSDLVKQAIKILEDNDIDLPKIKDVAFSPFEEKNGWGEPFDGTKLSCILN